MTPAPSGWWGRLKHEWRCCVGSLSGTDPPGGSRGWVLVTAVVPTATVVPPTLYAWLSIRACALWQRGLLLLASAWPAVLGVLHAWGAGGPPIPPWAVTWCGAATVTLTSRSLPVLRKKKKNKNKPKIKNGHNKLHFKWCFYCNVLHSHIHRCYRFVSQSIISSRLASSPWKKNKIK